MKKSLSIVLIAVLAFGFGIAYAAPMIVVPVDIQLLPVVKEGPKADFSVDVVYAKFDLETSKNTVPSESAVSYTVVLNVTNLSSESANLYELSFAAAQDISVKQSILGGTIYDTAYHSDDLYRKFGGIVDGVTLDGDWVNITWIPNIYYQDGNLTTLANYPLFLYHISKASLNNTIIEGPLTPAEVINFSTDHTINGTIPDLPANASDTGIWFEGVPITEYYDQLGNLIITEMYINGAWVDVTGRVTVDKTQPLMTTTNILLNQHLRIGSVYQNMNSTVGPVTTLPTWGDWEVGTVNYVWLPFETANQKFNPTFAPHESRLIIIYGTQTPSSLSSFESRNIKTYASASNYITNWPVNGTYYDTISTTTQIKQLQLEQTQTGYLYNDILADNQTFQPSNSYLEVTVVARTES